MALSPNRVEIDLSALAHNLGQVKKLVGTGTRIMGIVKSDAYGHGDVPVARTLEKNGIDCLGVSHLHEALGLRGNGIKAPVIILSGIHTREQAHEVIDKRLTPVVYDVASAGILAEECARTGKTVQIHLKVDTGMGRLGVADSDLGPFMRQIKALKALHIEGLMSHLSSADEPTGDYTEGQIIKFRNAIELGRSMGLALPLNNLANSAGIIAHRSAHFDLVRPGIVLYGGLPSPEFRNPLVLRPVMTFKGRILQVRDLPDHTPVSYGRSYYTEGRRKIAVLSAGYANGLLRSLSNRGKVLIGNRKVSIVGRVCMNLVMADISDINNVVPGSEAVFLGLQGRETINGDHMARWGNTISYEVFCSIGQRNPREYIQ